MKPDLIFMDIVMPGMNGYQATRTLANDPATRAIPIIMVTSKGQETDRIWGMRQGAMDYMVKPVAPAKLVAKGPGGTWRTERTMTSSVALSLRDRPFDLLPSSSSAGVLRPPSRAGDVGVRSRMGRRRAAHGGGVYPGRSRGDPRGDGRAERDSPAFPARALDQGTRQRARPAAADHGSAPVPGQRRHAVTRNTRVLVVNHREIPAGLIVDEVLGFRRFAEKRIFRRRAADRGALSSATSPAPSAAQRAVAGPEPAHARGEPEFFCRQRPERARLSCKC